MTVGGVHLKDLNPDIGTDADTEHWQGIHRLVLQSDQEVRELKGSNSWATALSITDICSSILNDANCIRPLSTYIKVCNTFREIRLLPPLPILLFDGFSNLK